MTQSGESNYVCPQCGPAPEGADEHARRAHTAEGLGLGTLGNFIMRATVDTRCFICGAVVLAGVEHRHDGPLSDLDRSDSDA